MSAPSAPLGTPDLRKQAEAAFEAGDLNQAKSLAADLARRTHLGPWEHFTLGRIALAAGDAKGAVTRLETALAARPGEGALLIELASAYAARKRWREAADTLVRADGDEKAARVWFDRPVDADSGSLAALSNLALLEEKACHLDAAIRLLKQVQGTPQDEARAHHRSGLLLLAQSMFAEGWPAYAARLKTKAYVSWQHLVEAPYWSGEDLSAKHLLVWTDQGLGEQILTAGFFPELVSLAEQVTIACDPRLVPLFKRCFAGMTVMSLNDLKDDTATRSAIGVQATISELGAQLRSAPDRFPAAGPYLLPDPVRVAALRARLSEQADGKPLVGISWRSANPLAGDAKSTSLAEHWGGVLKRDDVRFVSLQYGDTADELAAFEQTAAVSILRIGELDMTRDVDGFAALTAAMDAVLSTSNTTVHVAGALGKRVTAILPPAYVRPWYWFDRGDTSLWYPAVKLVRSDGDWRAAVQVAAETLDATALR
jgi:hypothetical protein